jgi:excisionase family DNA binding protein
MEDKLLTKNEICEYLKMSKSKIDILIRGKNIPYLKIGKNVRFNKDDMINWLFEKKRE